MQDERKGGKDRRKGTQTQDKGKVDRFSVNRLFSFQAAQVEFWFPGLCPG